MGPFCDRSCFSATFWWDAKKKTILVELRPMDLRSLLKHPLLALDDETSTLWDHRQAVQNSTSKFAQNWSLECSRICAACMWSQRVKVTSSRASKGCFKRLLRSIGRISIRIVFFLASHQKVAVKYDRSQNEPINSDWSIDATNLA